MIVLIVLAVAGAFTIGIWLFAHTSTASRRPFNPEVGMPIRLYEGAADDVLDKLAQAASTVRGMRVQRVENRQLLVDVRPTLARIADHAGLVVRVTVAPHEHGSTVLIEGARKTGFSSRGDAARVLDECERELRMAAKKRYGLRVVE